MACIQLSAVVVLDEAVRPLLGQSHCGDEDGSRGCQRLDCTKSIDRVQSFLPKYFSPICSRLGLFVRKTTRALVQRGNALVSSGGRAAGNFDSPCT